MKLFDDTGSISVMWEEDKENKKDELENSSRLLRSKSKISGVFENKFNKLSKQDSTKKNIFGSIKGKIMITPPTSTSKNTPTPSENITSEDKVASSRVFGASTDNIEPKLTTPEEKKIFTLRTSLRGKSDTRPNRSTRRHTEYGITSLNYRTEFNIPAEFLFCSHFEHNNSFASVYRKISSASNLRRSLSTGTIARPEADKTELSNSHKGSEKKKCDNRAYRSSSCLLRSTCEKMYSKTNLDQQSSKRLSRELLAGELQSIIDKKDNCVALNTSHEQPKKDTPQVITEEKHEEKKETNCDNSKVKEEVASNPRTPSNRRSQSCKSSQKRSSHLFNIGKYLRDRNTQRSKSFATIRDFSTNGTKKKNSFILNNKTESRKSLCNLGETNTLSAHNEEQEYDVTDGNATNTLSNVLQETPVKTRRSFDINDTDSRGNSCLHHASSNGDTSTIKYLLEQGGNVWVKNDDHRLPIDLAPNFQTAKLLSSATLFYGEHNDQRNERNIMQTSKLNIAL